MKNLSEALVENQRNSPNQIAITLLQPDLPDRPISYQNLFSSSTIFAQAMLNAGVRPGEIAILILPQSEALIYAFFGAILQGAIPSIMPFLTEKLSPYSYRKSIQALFTITNPSIVITNQAYKNDVVQVRGSTSSIRAILVVEELAREHKSKPFDLSGLTHSPADIVLLQHSSGTTGLQKGVALSHQAIFNQLQSYTRAIQLNSSGLGRDVIISWLPLYHDMGLIAGFIMPVLTRTHLVLMSPFDWVRSPQKLLHAITKYKGTLTWLPNFAYNFCAKKIRDRDITGIDLTSMRAFINCSEPMYWQSHQMFLDRFHQFGLKSVALATCYAMAENVFAVTQGGIESPVTEDTIDRNLLATKQMALPAADENKLVRMLSAGKPIQNTQIKIFNADMHELYERCVGEIAIQSDCLLTEYYQRPEITRKSFENGWYLTGDMGYIADGELYITGRKKDLIIVGGKNIYPQDLEQIASEVPGVHPGRVAAFGVYDELAGTEEVVIVAEIEDKYNTINEIANQIRARVTMNSEIALRKVKMVKRGWLLKTSSGKVARSANREKYLASNL